MSHADPRLRTDRSVHAETAQMEVVRYDRSGKWYLEPKDSTLKRQQVTISDAVKYVRWAEENARDEGFALYLRLPGGTAFDRGVSAKGTADE